MGGERGDDATWWDKLFTPVPDQWGLRGDPFAWAALHSDLRATPRPRDRDQLERALRAAFRRVVGVDVDDRRDQVVVETLAHGGMSSGAVDLGGWRERLLPLLVQRGDRTL